MQEAFENGAPNVIKTREIRNLANMCLQNFSQAGREEEENRQQ